MQEETQIIAALNSLMEVNNKRTKFYQFLVGKMRNDELRSLFRLYADQSQEFNRTLSFWRSAYGEFHLTKEKSYDDFWTQIASLLEHWLGKNLASKCEEMEHEALKAYAKVRQMPFIPVATASDIEHQSKAFDKSLAKLKNLLGNNVRVREELVHTSAL